VDDCPPRIQRTIELELSVAFELRELRAVLLRSEGERLDTGHESRKRACPAIGGDGQRDPSVLRRFDLHLDGRRHRAPVRHGANLGVDVAGARQRVDATDARPVLRGRSRSSKRARREGKQKETALRGPVTNAAAADVAKKRQVPMACTRSLARSAFTHLLGTFDESVLFRAQVASAVAGRRCRGSRARRHLTVLGSAVLLQIVAQEAGSQNLDAQLQTLMGSLAVRRRSERGSLCGYHRLADSERREREYDDMVRGRDRSLHPPRKRVSWAPTLTRGRGPGSRRGRAAVRRSFERCAIDP